MEKAMRQVRRVVHLRRDIDHDRSPLYSSSSEKSKDFYMSQMDLRQVLERWVGDHVEFEAEDLIAPPDRNVVPYTFQIKVTISTYPRLLVDYNLFVKMLLEDRYHLAKRERAYMRLDILTNLKKEILIYKVVIPKIKTFQKLNLIMNEFRASNLFSKCIGTRLSTKPVLPDLPDHSSAIVMFNPYEKYTFQTCETEGSRYNGFTYDIAILILRDMAHFHAGTIAMRLKDNIKFVRKIIPILNLKVKEFEQTPPFEMLCKDLISYGLRDLELPDDQMVALQDSLQLSRLYDRFVREETDHTWYALSYSRYSMSYIMTNNTCANATKPSKLIDLHRIGFDNCCKDLVSFIFTSVRPESFDEQRSFENLLQVYNREFIRTLQRHRVPIAKYTWDNFKAEFNTVGERMLATIFMNIRTSFCRNYKGDGDPILSNEYRKRIKATVKMMTLFKWIKASDFNSSVAFPDRDLIVLI
ncbi:hypothetical protein HUJ04_006808 [Dendroctonus ponderosae]|uniref:CHK kinase-like domain-containing protein n=1 Tax=Dendroctonus ponderosae TaxID=77166 RepID=A0AAR5Q519_DENPD|nr:hypothetical protein HUJ04_006808 [Dendroctonus ponderosae]